MDILTTPRPGDLIRIVRIGVTDPGEQLARLIGTEHRVCQVMEAPSGQPLIIVHGAAVYLDEIEIVERAEAGDR